jgi:rhodanese-related sulfurtransferase
MKAAWLAVSLLSLLLLTPALGASRVRPGGLHQKSPSPQRSGAPESSHAKDAEPLAQVPRITAEELQRLLKSNEHVVLVDTDDRVAYDAEHIKGAVNMAYDPAMDAQDRQAALGALPSDKLIVFYCNCSHEEDSAPLVPEMWQLGYDHDKVKALKGGLARWEQLGYPLAGTEVNARKEKEVKPTLSGP